MGLKEALEEAIAKGKADREREPAAQEQFHQAWLSRRQALLPVLVSAAETIGSALESEARADRENGSLFIQVEKEGASFKLTLSPDCKRKEVTCSFSFTEGGSEQYLPLDALTDGAIQKVLSHFAYSVALAPGAYSSKYEKEGVFTG